MNIRILLQFCLLICVFTNWQKVSAQRTQPARTYILLTWKNNSGSWQYLFHEGLTFDRSVGSDVRTKKGPISEVKRELLTRRYDRIVYSEAPKWGFRYPSDRQMSDLRDFTRAHDIHFEVLPMIEE